MDTCNKFLTSLPLSQSANSQWFFFRGSVLIRDVIPSKFFHRLKIAFRTSENEPFFFLADFNYFFAACHLHLTHSLSLASSAVFVSLFSKFADKNFPVPFLSAAASRMCCMLASTCIQTAQKCTLKFRVGTFFSSSYMQFSNTFKFCLFVSCIDVGSTWKIPSTHTHTWTPLFVHMKMHILHSLRYLPSLSDFHSFRFFLSLIGRLF